MTDHRGSSMLIAEMEARLTAAHELLARITADRNTYLEMVNQVREKHRGPRNPARYGSGCIQCGLVWPCPTYKIVAPEEEK